MSNTRPSRFRVVVVAALWTAALTPVAAVADESCDAVVARLTGTQDDGQGTLDLEHQAQLGNCSAAARLARRARNAQGYAKVHCPAAVQEMSENVLKLAQDLLQTPECQG